MWLTHENRSRREGSGAGLAPIPMADRSAHVNGAGKTPFSGPAADDMAWLSLSADADGHGIHEGDVLCMGVIPDDLDLHDADGSDLSWLALISADGKAVR